MPRQTTTPAILSEEPPGLLSLGWYLFLNLEVLEPMLGSMAPESTNQIPALTTMMMPALRPARHISHERTVNRFICQMGGQISPKSLIYEEDHFADLGEMVGAKR